MISVDNKVKNIYYMLCYTFYGDKLNEEDESSLGSEAFENIYNLFSLLLYMILKKQIKKGLHRDYNNTIAEIASVKGKIKISETINKSSLANKKVICEFDDYNENCMMNQIFKTTMYFLIKSNKIGIETKSLLKKTMNYFHNVQLIEIRDIKWDKIRFNRNNISFKYAVDICRLILSGLIVSDKNGNNKFKEFLDDSKVSLIYENFIKSYYKKHYPELKASSKKLYLTDDPVADFIPLMKTDITLEYNNKTLIIDAKFYNKILKSNYFDSKCKTISNDNLYQILAYVDNQDPYKVGNVYGMLLYAQTIDEAPISITKNINKHKILINTLNLNEDWIYISKKLNTIAELFMSDNF